MSGTGSHRTSRRSRSNPDAPLLIFGALVNFLLLILLLVLSYIREEPSLWVYGADWPYWVRDLVGIYYPGVLLVFLLLVAFTGVCIHLMSSRYTPASLAIILLPMLWGLFFMVILNSAANNLENLLTGRPLHWHAHDKWTEN